MTNKNIRGSKQMSLEELKELYRDLCDPSLIMAEALLSRIHKPYEAAEYLTKFVEYKAKIMLEELLEEAVEDQEADYDR
jgi:hypothetical protein